MKIQISPVSAFGFLLAIDARHPWSLVTEQSDDGPVLKFALLIDGTPSPHCVCLGQHGFWTLTTEIEP